MEYEIISDNTETRQLVVLYFDNIGNQLGTYLIDLPIVDGSVSITDDELEATIQTRAPIWLLENTTVVNTKDTGTAIYNYDIKGPDIISLTTSTYSKETASFILI